MLAGILSALTPSEGIAAQPLHEDTSRVQRGKRRNRFLPSAIIRQAKTPEALRKLQEAAAPSREKMSGPFSGATPIAPAGRRRRNG